MGYGNGNMQLIPPAIQERDAVMVFNQFYFTFFFSGNKGILFDQSFIDEMRLLTKSEFR